MRRCLDEWRRNQACACLVADPRHEGRQTSMSCKLICGKNFTSLAAISLTCDLPADSLVTVSQTFSGTGLPTVRGLDTRMSVFYRNGANGDRFDPLFVTAFFSA